MSTNIHIGAVREVMVVKTGKISQQSINFNAYQTPTTVTFEIIRSEDPAQAYKNWVLSIAHDEEMPVYADDDIFGEDEPVSYKTYNAGKEHVEAFDQWLAEAKEEGYDVQFEAW